MAEAVAHDRAAAAPSETFAERAFAPVVATCTAAVAVFLALRLTAWPPHEDETLALFVGRDSLDGMLGTVLNQRGGAPLHFLFAWAVAHLDGGLTALRAVSAVFAVASLPLLAVIAARLAGKGPAIVATILASASWMLLFHGIYGRMYSLFLFTSLLSFLALLGGDGDGWTTPLGSVDRRHPALRRGTPVRRARARLAGGLCRRDEAAAPRGGALVRDRPRAGHPLLAHRPRSGRPLRDRRRRRRGSPRLAARRAALPR